MKTKYISCLCHSDNHLMILRSWDDLNENDRPTRFITFNIQMGNFWVGRRILNAIKYCLGIKDTYHWEEVLIDREKANEIIEFLKENTSDFTAAIGKIPAEESDEEFIKAVENLS